MTVALVITITVPTTKTGFTINVNQNRVISYVMAM